MKAFLADNTWIVWWSLIMLVILRWFHLMASTRDSQEQEEPEYPAATPPVTGMGPGPAGSMAH